MALDMEQVSRNTMCGCIAPGTTTDRNRNKNCHGIFRSGPRRSWSTACRSTDPLSPTLTHKRTRLKKCSLTCSNAPTTSKVDELPDNSSPVRKTRQLICLLWEVGEMLGRCSLVTERSEVFTLDGTANVSRAYCLANSISKSRLSPGKKC